MSAPRRSPSAIPRCSSFQSTELPTQLPKKRKYFENLKSSSFQNAEEPLTQLPKKKKPLDDTVINGVYRRGCWTNDKTNLNMDSRGWQEELPRQFSSSSGTPPIRKKESDDTVINGVYRRGCWTNDKTNLNMDSRGWQEELPRQFSSSSGTPPIRKKESEKDVINAGFDPSCLGTKKTDLSKVLGGAQAPANPGVPNPPPPPPPGNASGVRNPFFYSRNTKPY
ncbi:uncharacterized protein LOC112568777 isoform X2 [Pomacea canaliculata]|uniref:uncharacterized protein LOC112568777 isoform X2 n=1 Tax=Pomacea canaliculata TaxID=400727 RepID=UPI000D7362A7|nr:uncharacterized protein LOC112568777 isoform X2 [Pomacea canaliculata]